MSTSLTPAYRHAFVASDPVTTMWGQELTPYRSGVTTMDRDATRLLRRVIPPLLVLTRVRVLPGGRSLIRGARIGEATGAPGGGAQQALEAERPATLWNETIIRA